MRLYYGNRFTILQDRKKELKKGTLADMLKQLDINPKDF